MKIYKLVLVLFALTTGCITSNRAKRVVCPNYLPHDKNHCELEYWENIQFKDYRKQELKNKWK